MGLKLCNTQSQARCHDNLGVLDRFLLYCSDTMFCPMDVPTLLCDGNWLVNVFFMLVFLVGSKRSARAMFQIAWAESKFYIRALMNRWILEKQKSQRLRIYWKEARPSWMIIQKRCAQISEKDLFEHRSGKVLKRLTLVMIYSNCFPNSAILNLRPHAMITWCFRSIFLLYFSATSYNVLPNQRSNITKWCHLISKCFIHLLISICKSCDWCVTSGILGTHILTIEVHANWWQVFNHSALAVSSLKAVPVTLATIQTP